MQYIVRLGDERSAAFKALIGILIGDPASPTLWNIMFADFQLPADPDDVFLGDMNASVNVSHLEHADDVLLQSYSARGLQSKLDAVYYWCSINFLLINAIKSECAIFERLPNVLPIFHFANKTIVIKEQFTYVGIIFHMAFQSHFYYSARARLFPARNY